MDLAPWEPYSRVMSDYFHGKHDARLVIYDDFERDEAPISFFFRDPSGFSPVDHEAVNQARGRVLDVGAGSGCLALALQDRGIEVVALETLPELVKIMRARGVRDVRTGNIFDFEGETFDTVIMMMNGLGIGETIDGLAALLDRIRALLRPGGQLISDSCDLRIWDAAGRPDDSQLTRPDGRYLGELHIQLEYQGEKAPPFEQLYVDPVTLARVATRAGWTCEVILEIPPGYVVRMQPVSGREKERGKREE